jgi:hypothetical protein
MEMSAPVTGIKMDGVLWVGGGGRVGTTIVETGVLFGVPVVTTVVGVNGVSRNGVGVGKVEVGSVGVGVFGVT